MVHISNEFIIFPKLSSWEFHEEEMLSNSIFSTSCAPRLINGNTQKNLLIFEWKKSAFLPSNSVAKLQVFFFKSNNNDMNIAFAILD